MKVRTISMVTALIPAVVQMCSGAEAGPLRVYLPREVSIKSESLTLGSIAVLRGDEGLAGKAGQIALGRLSIAGQKIVIDRPTILSRLASNGVSAADVAFSGAESVTVTADHKVISSASFVETAKAFLAQTFKGSAVADFEPTGAGQDMPLPGRDELEFVPRLVGSAAGNQVKVEIMVKAGGKTIGTWSGAFRAKYRCRKVVTTMDVAAGQVLGEANTRIETILANYPEPGNWTNFRGWTAKRDLAADTVLEQGMAAMAERPVLVERNQNVVIGIETAGLVVTAMGKAMEQGKAGDIVKVKNIDSGRVIAAKINEDGTVEPVF